MMRADDSKNRVTTYDFAVVDNKMYFSSLNCNSLYCYDITEKKLNFIAFFPNELLSRKNLHGAVVHKNNKLYFAPCNADNIAIYDLNCHTFTLIDTSKYNENCKNSKSFVILENDNILYMIPSRSEYIISINTDNDEVFFHNEWCKNIDLHKNEKIPAIKYGAFIYENSIYMPYLRDNLIIKVSLTSFLSELIRIGNYENGFTDAVFDSCNKIIWLLKLGECSIIKYSIVDGKTCEYAFSTDNKQLEYPYIKMIDMGDSLLLIPYMSNAFIKFDKNECKFTITRNVEIDDDADFGAAYYSCNRIDDSTVLAMKTGKLEIESIDSDGNVVDKYIFTDAMKSQRLMFAGSKQKYLLESKEFGLEEYLNCI